MRISEAKSPLRSWASTYSSRASHFISSLTPFSAYRRSSSDLYRFLIPSNVLAGGVDLLVMEKGKERRVTRDRCKQEPKQERWVPASSGTVRPLRKLCNWQSGSSPIRGLPPATLCGVDKRLLDMHNRVSQIRAELDFLYAQEPLTD